MLRKERLEWLRRDWYDMDRRSRRSGTTGREPYRSPGAVVAVAVVVSVLLGAVAPAAHARGSAHGVRSVGQVVTGSGRLPAASPSAVSQQDFVVSAALSWQRSSVYVQQGQTVGVMADGSWTMGDGQFDFVGPEGYDPSEDALFWQGCKIKRQFPYALLLAKSGGGHIVPVGDGLFFRADRSGWIKFRMHDGTPCLQDNAGEVTATVTVY